MKKGLLCAALLLALTACAPSPAPAPTATPVPSDRPGEGPTAVYTDWSKLDGRPTPVGSRWYEGYVGELRPRADYGTLIPYAGRRLVTGWPAEDGCLYGLMTAEGKAVTDPVYTEVKRPAYLLGDAWYTHPLLLLSRADGDGKRVAVAAADGSWVTGFDYDGYRASREGVLLRDGERMTLMDPAGKIVGQYDAEKLGLIPENFDPLLRPEISLEEQWFTGLGGQWVGDLVTLAREDLGCSSLLVLRISTGETFSMPTGEWEELRLADLQGAWSVERGRDGIRLTGEDGRTCFLPTAQPDQWVAVRGEFAVLYGTNQVYTLDGVQVFPPDERLVLEWRADKLLGDGGPALVVRWAVGDDAHYTYFLTDGTPVPMLEGWEDGRLTGEEYLRCGMVGGLIERVGLDTAEYFDPATGECVFRTILGYEGE